MSDPTRQSVGCLGWIAALAGLGVLTAAILWFTLFRGGDDQDPDGATPPDGTAAAPTATDGATAAGCTDATEEFRSLAAGPGVEYVRGVCWENDGQLRAEIELAADVNVDSAPMQGLCNALTDFILASDRPWQGFTGYSSSPLTPGQPLLTRAQPDQPCQNPFQG